MIQKIFIIFICFEKSFVCLSLHSVFYPFHKLYNCSGAFIRWVKIFLPYKKANFFSTEWSCTKASIKIYTSHTFIPIFC